MGEADRELAEHVAADDAAEVGGRGCRTGGPGPALVLRGRVAREPDQRGGVEAKPAQRASQGLGGRGGSEHLVGGPQLEAAALDARCGDVVGEHRDRGAAVDQHRHARARGALARRAETHAGAAAGCARAGPGQIGEARQRRVVAGAEGDRPAKLPLGLDLGEVTGEGVAREEDAGGCPEGQIARMRGCGETASRRGAGLRASGSRGGLRRRETRARCRGTALLVSWFHPGFERRKTRCRARARWFAVVRHPARV